MNFKYAPLIALAVLAAGPQGGQHGGERGERAAHGRLEGPELVRHELARPAPERGGSRGPGGWRPEFIAKVRDVVGLYMSPPEHALVLAVDEKSQIQALDRTAPCLPARSCRRGASLLRHVRVVPCTLLPEFVPACTKPRGQDDRAWGSGPAVRIGQPRGPGERPPASCRVTRSPDPPGLILLADRAGRMHRLAGAGIRSRARCPPRAGTVASDKAKDVTEGSVLRASRERVSHVHISD
jgi:hypothetical protein